MVRLFSCLPHKYLSVLANIGLYSVAETWSENRSVTLSARYWRLKINGGAIQMGLWTIVRLFFSGYSLVAYIIQRRYGYILNVEGNLELECWILIGVPRGWCTGHSTLAFRPFILEGPKWYGLECVFSNKLEKTRLYLDCNIQSYIM